ncbi:MAG: lipid II:glycine glycyltransferase FemX, partial [Chloroflexota bacterium]
MPDVTLTQWRNFTAAHPDIHLLQTAEWGELKSAFGWTPARIISGDAGVQILFRKLPLGFTIGYIPKVDSGKWGVDNGIWKDIDIVCKKHHAIFCKLEPDAWQDEFILHPSSFIFGKHNIQPPRTITLDISGSEDDILARMKQKTRYNVRLAEKKGVTVRAWD